MELNRKNGLVDPFPTSKDMENCLEMLTQAAKKIGNQLKGLPRPSNSYSQITMGNNAVFLEPDSSCILKKKQEMLIGMIENLQNTDLSSEPVSDAESLLLLLENITKETEGLEETLEYTRAKETELQTEIKVLEQIFEDLCEINQGADEALAEDNRGQRDDPDLLPILNTLVHNLKDDLNTVLSQLYPSMKDDIKTILVMLDKTRIKENEWVELDCFCEAVAFLIKTGIIVQNGSSNKFKLVSV